MSASFTVTRAWRYEGYEGGIEESLILVDGQQIGGVYHCEYNPNEHVSGWGWNDGGQTGESWASYGPRGYSFGHATREAAEQAQVREYATNPDLFDRRNAQELAESEAEEARREAELAARDAERDEADRVRRLGDDEPGPTVWTLPAYHVMYAPLAEVDAVTVWFEANGVENVIATREVRVEQRVTRRVIVFETAPAAVRLMSKLWQGNDRHGLTETRVVTLLTEPPEVTGPPRQDLHLLFEEHWPARFPLIDFGRTTGCGACTKAGNEASRKTATAPFEVVPWPCPVVEAAIAVDPSERAA